MTPERVQRTYYLLLLLQTLAASLIWGINTLFLLDAGLSITQAFIANAAYTAGMVIFEDVPEADEALVSLKHNLTTLPTWKRSSPSAPRC